MTAARALALAQPIFDPWADDACGTCGWVGIHPPEWCIDGVFVLNLNIGPKGCTSSMMGYICEAQAGHSYSHHTTIEDQVVRWGKKAIRVDP